MQSLTRALVVIGGLGVTYVAASAFGAWRWSGVTSDLVAKLDAGRATSRHDVAELADLPAPVQRYFRAALTASQPIITALRLTQTGRFNLSATADQWEPFTATQHFTTARPSFVWDANTTLASG